jgi:hypothetical protein
MMNLNDLTDEVLAYLRSFTKDQDGASFITADIDESVLEIPIADPNYISRGRVQIEDEIVWVDRVDRDKKIAYLPPYGRGMDGTVPAPHQGGTQATNNPLYPRHLVHKTINQTINMMGADLYAVKSIQRRATTIGYSYEMPEDTRNILSISYIAQPQSYKFPTFVSSYTFDPNCDPSISETGKCVFIYDVVTPLFTYNITYAGWPDPLKDGESDFSETGLPVSSYDCVVLGTAARMLSVATAAMIQSQSIEANVVDQRTDPASITGQSKYLFGLFRQRLDEERLRLLNSTNIRSYYAR